MGVNRSKVTTTRMAVLTEDSGNVVAMDETTAVAMETEEQQLYNDVLQTSRFFTSLVELLPAKFYLGHRGEEEENVFNPKHMKKRKKKPPPADKKFLAKKAKLFKLDPSQHKTITELQEEVEKKEKEELAKDLPRITMATKIQPISVSEVSSTQSLADLHDKLHAKRDQLRGNRKVVPEDKINDRKRKHLDKKKVNIEKKRKEKESGNIKVSNAIENNALNNNKNNNKNNNNNNSNDVVFSKFDFATSVKERDPKKKKKKKDLKQLLTIAETKQNELKLLEETDAEKAKETKAEMCWDSALQKASGTKIKDNPKLLKKTLKRKEKEKSKSEKVWKDRVDNVEKKKEEKQKLRKQHLKERREAGNGKKKGGGKKKKKPPKK